MLLEQQCHAFGCVEVTGLYRVEVDAGGEVAGVERYVVAAFSLVSIHQCGYHLAQHVVDLNPHLACFWQAISDDGRWIKRIRIVLQDAELCGYRCNLPHIPAAVRRRWRCGGAIKARIPVLRRIVGERGVRHVISANAQNGGPARDVIRCEHHLAAGVGDAGVCAREVAAEGAVNGS